MHLSVLSEIPEVSHFFQLTNRIAGKIIKIVM
jgi:hypothetical protein